MPDQHFKCQQRTSSRNVGLASVPGTPNTAKPMRRAMRAGSQPAALECSDEVKAKPMRGAMGTGSQPAAQEYNAKIAAAQMGSGMEDG